MRIIIADAQIEPVPKELWGEPAVLKDSKRRKRHPSRILLYTPIHYTAMIRHGLDIRRRGRPDITHDILKTILNHPIKDSIDLEIYIHTIQDILIWVNPDTRIPHNYYQFEGIMIQLLKHGKIPPEDGTLLKRLDYSIDKLLKGPIYLLSEDGENMEKVIDKLDIGNTVFIIGGFQEGDFSKKYRNIKNRISIYERPLYASTATCIFLTEIWKRKTE